MLILLRPARGGRWVIALSLGALLAAIMALQVVLDHGERSLFIGGWEAGLAIRFRLTPLAALLLVFTAGLHLLVALYAARIAHATGKADYWPLSCLLHAALAALWLSADLFNLYVTLELLSLVAVALVSLAGRKAWKPALNYLLLSLAGSLAYLLGVALLYGRYGLLDLALLARLSEADGATHLALLLMSVGLMLKAALWPLHLWLPPAHAAAPTAVSALLSALVVKGPLYILWLIWSEIAPAEFGRDAGLLFGTAGVLALVAGGWSALRAPRLKTLVAYSTVAQLGYALLALGLLLHLPEPRLHAALWLFVLAHGLAKVSMFLAAGELQTILGSKRVKGMKGQSERADRPGRVRRGRRQPGGPAAQRRLSGQMVAAAAAVRTAAALAVGAGRAVRHADVGRLRIPCSGPWLRSRAAQSAEHPSRSPGAVAGAAAGVAGLGVGADQRAAAALARGLGR